MNGFVANLRQFEALISVPQKASTAELSADTPSTVLSVPMMALSTVSGPVAGEH